MNAPAPDARRLPPPAAQEALADLRAIEGGITSVHGQLEPAELGYYGSEHAVARARKALFSLREVVCRMRAKIEAAATTPGAGGES